MFLLKIANGQLRSTYSNIAQTSDLHVYETSFGWIMNVLKIDVNISLLIVPYTVDFYSHVLYSVDFKMEFTITIWLLKDY